MDHEHIEGHNLIERYLLGRLPAAEEARFEEHLVGCARCQEELEAAEGLRAGLRAVAATEAARQSLGGAPRGSANRPPRWRPWVLAAAAALTAAFLTSAWFLNGGAPPGVAASRTPIANAPVLLLDAVRGEPGPAPVLDLHETGPWVVLAVDAYDPRFESYRATLLAADGEELWRGDALRPNALDTLMVIFPTATFEAGELRLLVEGKLPGGGMEELGSHPFRVAN